MVENSLDVHLLPCFPTETKLIKKNIIKQSGSNPSPFSWVASEEADCETSQAGQRGSETFRSQRVNEQKQSEWWTLE